MTDLVFQLLNVTFELLFYILYILLFYLSVKKCFWKGDKSKVKLFIFTFLTNPMICFVLLIGVIVAVVSFLTGSGNAETISTVTGNTYTILITDVSWIFYLILMFLFANLIGKWLGTPNKQLVTFLYLMFSVLYIFAVRNDQAFSDNVMVQTIINASGTLAFLVAVIIFYFYDVKALSGLTDRERTINWKIFVIPPTAFNVFYIVFATVLAVDTNKQTTLVLYVFSSVLIYLFIWAFYVIIKNIIATNEAIEARDEVKTLSVEVMEALAHTIDAKDRYTNGHSVRVAKYSRMIAEKMGLSPVECENIYFMGLLHDIGKIGVPNEIINKPSRLTDAEYDIIKTHPGIGYNILSEIKSRPDLAKGARWHHERYDGRGYPDKKAGEDIPLESRIIAVADTYDAMTSNRSYRKYLPQDVVRAEIEKNSGTQFDPEAAKYMIMIINEDKDYVLHE